MKRFVWSLVGVVCLFAGGCSLGLHFNVFYTLTVNSTNPASGVAISLSPVDTNGAGAGTTSFTRSYTSGTVVTLTAPATSGGNSFASWTGCQTSNSLTCTLTLNADTTVTATYSAAPPALLTPTVMVTPSAASITTALPLSVTIAVNGGVGSPLPTGSVTIASGGYTSAAATLSNGSVIIAIPAGSLAAGSDTLKATYTPDATSASTYNAASGSGTVNVTASSATPTAQTITFLNPGAQTVGTPLTLYATANSGLPVSFASATTNVCTVNNTTATFLSTGTCTIQASQAGNSTYAAASSVSQSFTVNSAEIAPTVTVSVAQTSITPSQPLNVAIAVNGGAGNPTPTGSVILSSGSYLSSSAALSNGGATIVVAAGALGLGLDSLTATYTPDSASISTYKASTGMGSVNVIAGQSTTPTVMLTANPTTINPGESSTLTWSTTNASSCIASGGWSGTQNANGGSQAVSPAATSFYTITCTGTDGAASATATTSVGVVFSSTNKQSPLGINLAPPFNSTSEVPFLNVFKTASISPSQLGGWITQTNSNFDTGEEKYLQLDANGYPTTLTASSADPHTPQQFTFIGVQLFLNLPASNAGGGSAGPPYRSGQYVVLYDGEGAIKYNFDAALVSSSAGRDVINVAKPSGAGILMQISSTDPNHTGNYIRNIRLVKAEEEAALNSGQVFDPAFLALIQNFHALRFMDWLQTNGNTLSLWSSRPQVNNAGWSPFFIGVPLEVPLALCNTMSADCWLNTPAGADNDYITQMATLVHNQLSPNLHVYIEFSNEVWNGAFSQFQYAANQGLATWPSLGTGNAAEYAANRNWFGMRTAQMCDIWAQVWGSDFSRVHCVLGAQAANTGTADYSLECSAWTGAGNAPCANHHITDVAIAPYFATDIPASSFSETQPNQLNDLFTDIDGAVAGVSQWEKNYQTDSDLVKYKLPFIAYEGGEGLTPQTSWNAAGNPTSPSLDAFTSLYGLANLDPRIDTATTDALVDWKTNGGKLFMYFNDIQEYSSGGEWGALQSFLDVVTPLSAAPPKWQALQDFITNNPCWWTDCSQ